MPSGSSRAYAYVKILGFGETTSAEMEDNLRRLGENNIRRTGAGSARKSGRAAQQGVAVADHFLPKNALIVSHRGRAAPEKAYMAEHGNRGRELPDRGAGESLFGVGGGDCLGRACRITIAR